MNFDKQFKDFHSDIKLYSSKKNDLIKGRDALREKIRQYFRQKDKLPIPKFYMQGSFSMATIINPISAEYDLDDGVYIQNIDTSKPMNEWESPEKVHKWIVEAVDNHTSKSSTDKNLCVRVNYVDNKHVDLPIYTTKDGEHYLAVKNRGWIESNPKEISDWFSSQVKKHGEQYRRIVRYLKAWKDFRENDNNSTKLFGGFQLTVLASYYFIEDEESDEESFYKTIQSIENNLWKYSSSIAHPKKNSQNLIEHYSDTRKNNFQDEFKNMFIKAEKAHKEDDCEEKAKKWQKVFGDRFLIPSEQECKQTMNKSAPAIILGTTDIANTSGRQA